MLRYTQGVKEWRKALVAKIKADEREQELEEEDLKLKKEADGAMKNLIKKYIDLDKVMAMARNPAAALQLAFVGLLKLTIEATMQYDKQRAALAAVTAGMTKYNQGLADTMQGAANFNLSMQEAGEGFNALASSFVDFGTVGKAQRQELALVTAGFKRFGIDIGANLNIATKAMGFNATQAKDLQLSLLATGQAMGPHMTKKIMSEFGPAMQTLNHYTRDRAIKVFKALGAQMQATGLAMSDLLGIAAKFDTYDSAAESVGKLNSILGGDYLNSVQMLRATEEDRIKMLQRSIRLSGRNFSNLSRYEKRAVAAAVGITDMSKAMQVFGNSQEQLADWEKRAKEAGMSVDQFKKSIKATNDVGKQFKILLQNLAIVAKPIIDFLTLIASGLAALLSQVENTGAKIGILIGILVLFKLIMTGIGMALALLPSGGIIAGLFGGAGFGTTAMAILQPMLVIFAIVAMIGAGLYLFGKGAEAAGKGMSALAAGFTALFEVSGKSGFWAKVKAIGAMTKLSIIGAGGGTDMVVTAASVKEIANSYMMLARAMERISRLDKNVLIRTRQIFENISKVTPASAKEAKAVIENFGAVMHKISVDKKEQKVIKVELTHNNIAKTGAALEDLICQTVKACGPEIVCKVVNTGK